VRGVGHLPQRGSGVALAAEELGGGVERGIAERVGAGGTADAAAEATRVVRWRTEVALVI